MPRSAWSTGSSTESYHTAPSDYDTPYDHYSNLPATSIDFRSRVDSPGTWPPRSERTDFRISERARRGYNPSLYGEIAPVAGSSPNLRNLPDQRDLGYSVESPDEFPPIGTPMGIRYREYKTYDEHAYESEKEYKRRLKEISPAPNKKHRTEDYRGNPLMTPAHHRQMGPYAANAVDATCQHINLRSEYDRDYIGHYSSKAQRKRHTSRIMQEERREERLRVRDDEHRRFGFHEDKRSQQEAKDGRIREKKERHRRWGYERSAEDERY